MNNTTPVEVGTRGTIGSLVMQEIEYFRKLEPNCHKIPELVQPQPKSQITTIAPSSSGSRMNFGFGFVFVTSKRKKKSGFLPRMCSFVQVAETNRPTGVPGFSYRNLKTDAKKLQQD